MNYHNIFLQPHLLYHVWINGDMKNYSEFMTIQNLIKSDNDLCKFNLLDSDRTKKITQHGFVFLKLQPPPNIAYQRKKNTLSELMKSYNIAKDESIEAIQLPRMTFRNLTIKEIPCVEGLPPDAEHPKYLIALVRIENNFSTFNEYGENNNMDSLYIINQFQQHLGKSWEISWIHVHDEWWKLKILVSDSTEIFSSYHPILTASKEIEYLNKVKKCAMTLLINYGFNINKNMYEWHLAQGLVHNMSYEIND